MKKLSLSTVAVLIATTMAVSVHAKDYYFSPSDADQLKALLKSESLCPGDNVILRDGTYDSIGNVDIFAKGTAEDTVSIRSEHPGMVIFTGPLHFRLFGEYIKLDGIYFNKAWAIGGEMIEFRRSKTETASNCRMTNCVIDDCNNPEMSETGREIDGKKPKSEYWIKFFGKNNRLDHCYLANKRVGGLVLQVEINDDFSLLVRMGVYERPTAQTDTKAEPLTSYHRVENVDFSYNHFVDCPKIILCSGFGDKSPRNVRFANNEIVGSTNNLMVHDPETNLKGFFFINNRYNFKDNSVIPFKGFDGTDNLDVAWGKIEKDRVVRLLDKVGVSSYTPSQHDMHFILNGYL